MATGLATTLSLVSSPVTAWYSKQTAVTEMIGAVNERITELRFETERDFVKKGDLKEMRQDVTEIKTNVAEINGYLKALARKQHGM